MTFDNLVAQINELAETQRDRGTYFEYLARAYFQNEPILVINHALHNGLSNDIFSRQVKNAISDIFEQESSDYSAYINEVFRAIDVNQAKQIIDEIEFTKFQSLLKGQNLRITTY